jgi:rhodanese-related sulfurtransferase
MKINNQDKVLLLDVRDAEKYEDFHIIAPSVESINVHKATIFQLVENEEPSLPNLSKDKEIIVTCTTGNSAGKCAKILSERNYEVTVLEGGLTAWKEYLGRK